MWLRPKAVEMGLGMEVPGRTAHVARDTNLM